VARAVDEETRAAEGGTSGSVGAGASGSSSGVGKKGGHHHHHLRAPPQRFGKRGSNLMESGVADAADDEAMDVDDEADEVAEGKKRASRRKL